jgi:predicted nuclease of predicted toxin-antitoxin system
VPACAMPPGARILRGWWRDLLDRRQLPPGLALWLSATFEVEALALVELGLRDADDVSIFDRARSADVVLVTKDSDFVELVSRHGPPPRMLWVTCGNVTNRRLRDVFTSVFRDACALLEEGRAIVEIADRD